MSTSVSPRRRLPAVLFTLVGCDALSGSGPEVPHSATPATSPAASEPSGGKTRGVATPAKRLDVRKASWRGTQVSYVVQDGLAVTGGDMVIGRVDRDGNLM